MTHFAILVAVPEGKELDDVMLPYHEYECTGIEKYIQFVPCDMDELLKDFAEHGKGEDLDTFAWEWASYRKDSAGVYGRFTNPNKKWDRYTVGGRWHGEFGIDTATKANFHLNLVREAQFAHRLGQYNTWKSLRAELDAETPDQKIVDKMAEWFERNEETKKLYNGDPIAAARDDLAFNAIDWFMWSLDDAKMMHSTEADFTAATSWRCPFHGFIDLDGKWHERGDMGWFAMCDDENKTTFDGEHGEFWSFVEALPDDAMLYVVDCHI